MTQRPSSPRSYPKVRSISIPESELHFSFARSGGPGGQNVNKVETKVTVIFDFATSQSLSWEEKGRLGHHPLVLQTLNSDGAIAITSQAHRSQVLNRADAVQKLHDLLRQALRPKRKRIPTKKTRSSERKRLEGKKVRSKSKATRRRIDSHSDE